MRSRSLRRWPVTPRTSRPPHRMPRWPSPRSRPQVNVCYYGRQRRSPPFRAAFSRPPGRSERKRERERQTGVRVCAFYGRVLLSNLPQTGTGLDYSEGPEGVKRVDDKRRSMIESKGRHRRAVKRRQELKAWSKSLTRFPETGTTKSPLPCAIFSKAKSSVLLNVRY